MKSAGLSAVLSFSGLGQIYNGQILKGLIIIVVQVINGALTTVLAIVWVWAIYDAYQEAERINAKCGFG